MRQMILRILQERNMDFKNHELLYKAGLDNIISNIEFYFDKPYTCESVFRELFRRGVINEIKKTQSV